MQDAPGRQVIEPRRHSWRAGYVIVPIAIVVGLLQVVVASHRGGGGGWSQDRRQQVSTSDVPAANGGAAAKAPRAERRSARESIGHSVAARLPLVDRRPEANAAGAADGTAAPEPPAIRVVIHHAAGTNNALPAIQLAAFLQARGFAVTNLRPVDVEIERPSVRYFFAGDQPETRRLVEAIGAFFAKVPGRAPDQAADFSHHSPKPRQGNVEVWLPPPGAGDSQSA